MCVHLRFSNSSCSSSFSQLSWILSGWSCSSPDGVSIPQAKIKVLRASFESLSLLAVSSSWCTRFLLLSQSFTCKVQLQALEMQSEKHSTNSLTAKLSHLLHSISINPRLEDHMPHKHRTTIDPIRFPLLIDQSKSKSSNNKKRLTVSLGALKAKLPTISLYIYLPIIGWLIRSNSFLIDNPEH